MTATNKTKQNKNPETLVEEVFDSQAAPCSAGFSYLCDQPGNLLFSLLETSVSMILASDLLNSCSWGQLTQIKLML